MFKKILKYNIFVFFLLAVFLNAKADTLKYPSITEWQGQAWITGKDGHRQLIHAKKVLREKALLETSSSGKIKILLDDKRTVTLLGSSELSIPIIGWEHGEVPVIILKNGDLHWQQNVNEKGLYNVALSSDLFEFIAPPGDFIYTMDRSKAFAGVRVFEGSIEFSALNGEESVLVKKGQQVGFQGVLENGEISYDVLLKGKKVPKGNLTEVSAIDRKEVAQVAEKEKKRLQKISSKKNKDRAALIKSKEEGTICSDPAGKFNECAWICLNNPKKEKKICLLSTAQVSCVRRRCNANGEWAEEFVLNAEKGGSKCKAQPVVAPCDY
ncbi:MAG: hypothetical protein ACXVCP_17225 [Bdellovibrio sp.]